MIKIFIGCSTECSKLAKAIKANLEEENVGEVRIWSEIYEPTKYTLDQILEFAKNFDFGVFLWSDEDKINVRNINYMSPRDNVLLETGIFFGSLGRERVFILIPKDSNVKIPTDLLGLGVLFYNKPSDNNYVSAVSTACEKIRTAIDRISDQNLKQKVFNSRIYPNPFYSSFQEALNDIQRDLLSAVDIKILTNKGRSIFGNSGSVIDPNKNLEFIDLRKIQILLISPESRWINRGLMALRKYETIQDVKNEIVAISQVVELNLKKFTFGKTLSRNTGIRYFLGEPYFRIIMTEKNAYVISYHEHDLNQKPVYKFKNEIGSLYGAFRRYFQDVWKNQSEFKSWNSQNNDFQILVGGIVTKVFNHTPYIALVMREDGSWILPKGQKHDDDMNLEIAAIREVAEELGIRENDIFIEKEIQEYSYDDLPEFHTNCKTVKFFHMSLNNERLINLETDKDHKEARWWVIGSNLPFMFYHYQKILIAEFIEMEYRIQVKFQDEK